MTWQINERKIETRHNNERHDQNRPVSIISSWPAEGQKNCNNHCPLSLPLHIMPTDHPMKNSISDHRENVSNGKCLLTPNGQEF